MKIDIACHITPPKFLKALESKIAPAVSAELPSRWLPSLADLDLRFKVMDKYQDMVHVLTVTNPPVEAILNHQDAIDLSKLVNDELAELLAKYPKRFVGAVACLPMNDMDATLKEAERAVKELHLNGVQIFTNVMGKPLDSPEFYPLYGKMCELDRPIWIHPFFQHVGGVAQTKEQFDAYRVFTGKKDPAWAMARAAFDLPAASSLAMTRLVYGKVFDLFPNIKIITHHCGSTIPYLFNRIEMHYLMFGEKERLEVGLKKPVPEYFKMFYGDTALHGNVPALMCGYEFFGADHILFGTDMPFGSENGLWPVRMTVDSVEKMPISAAEREKIYEGNAKKLLKLKI
jgi:uncharacterized protein